jgi:hypothetical protein
MSIVPFGYGYNSYYGGYGCGTYGGYAYPAYGYGYGYPAYGYGGVTPLRRRDARALRKYGGYGGYYW